METKVFFNNESRTWITQEELIKIIEEQQKRENNFFCQDPIDQMYKEEPK